MNIMIEKFIGAWLPLLLVIFLITGCGQQLPTSGTVSIITPDFFGIGEEIALQLAGNLRQPLNSGEDVIMTTVVDLDDLHQTSRFGRTLTEAVATRMFQHGFTVIEVRKSTELLVENKSGELMLTRDVTLLASEFPVRTVVVGTYALTPDTVIVNMKIVDVYSHEVLSVAGLEIQRSASINHLLHGRAGSGSMMFSAYER